MRDFIFLISFLFCAVLSKAQSFDDRQIDNLVFRIPVDKTYTTADIADYINKNFTTERKKLLAIYSWVASNIKYDTDSANVINMGLDHSAKITAALRRRRGVCENYAAIFNDLCLKCGIISFIVDGYTKQNSVVDKTGHSWCTVFTDNTWLLCDPTWDESTGNTKYFLVEPLLMIETHMPFDPLWQLLNYPVSHSMFYTGNIYYHKNLPYINYVDSVTAYIKLDSLQRLKSTAYRIEQSGLYNNMVKNRHDQTKMNIEIIREDKDVDLYNSAVAELNTATNTYNNFVEYRNKKFSPAITDNALQALFNGIDARLSSAHEKLDEIAKTEASFKFSTDAIRDRLNALELRVNVQKDFLKTYLSTAAPNRASLFYSKQLTLSDK
jgi:transglutaminase/protease-like cytokinesis protein 3